MAAANDSEREKGGGKKKKGKATPKKERQISLRLSAKGAKRLNKLTEATEWSVTQVVEEALKVYAAREGIVLDDKAEDAADGKAGEQKTEGGNSENVDMEVEDTEVKDAEVEDAEPKIVARKLSNRKTKARQTADAATT